MSERKEFAELQKRLRALWPSVSLRSIGDVERTVVIVHSISMDVPEQLIPVFPAYEERFLCHRPQPAPLAALARHLRHLAADPAQAHRLLLRARSRARHAPGAQPLRSRVARGRPQRAPDAEAARPAGRDRADPLPDRTARAGDPAALRHLRGRGRARRPAGHPALRRRPGARAARHEEREPARLRRGRRVPRARLRRRRRARRAEGARRAALGQRGARDGRPQARSWRERARQRARRRRRRPRLGHPGRRARARGRRGRRGRLLAGARRSGRDRRGADRGRRPPQPERPAPDQPFRAGRDPLDARPGARTARTGRPTSAAAFRPIPSTPR